MTDAGTAAAGRIVVGVDGSESSKAALAWALRQAELTGADLEAVITWAIPTSAAVAGALPEGYDPAGDATRELNAAVESAHPAHPDVAIRTTVLEGATGPALVECATGAQLLVVGSRGHGFVAGLLLGSVSEYCVSHASCPVLVMRHPDPSA